MTRKTWNSKKDKSHNDIRDLLQQAGFGVIETHHVHGGFPDLIATSQNAMLVIGDFNYQEAARALSGISEKLLIWPGGWLPVEAKEEAGSLTDDQVDFHREHSVLTVTLDELRNLLEGFLTGE